MFRRAGSQPLPVEDRFRFVQTGWADGFSAARPATSALLPEAVGFGRRRARDGAADSRQRDHDG